jgi:hypothetical protein
MNYLYSIPELLEFLDRPLDEEQHYELLHTSPSPHLRGKEVGGHDQFPVTA